MPWMLPDPPQSERISDHEAYVAMLERLTPKSAETRDALIEARAVLKELKEAARRGKEAA